jgi:hypothetical protein
MRGVLDSVICQINTPDSLSCATEKGRDTLFDASNKRQDDVYRRLYDDSVLFVPYRSLFSTTDILL